MGSKSRRQKAKDLPPPRRIVIAVNIHSKDCKTLSRQTIFRLEADNSDLLPWMFRRRPRGRRVSVVTHSECANSARGMEPVSFAFSWPEEGPAVS